MDGREIFDGFHTNYFIVFMNFKFLKYIGFQKNKNKI